MRHASACLSFALVLSSAFAGMSFEERVDAQAAIDRVYHAHQIGGSLPFERAVPRAALEEKVRAYLAKNAQLERRRDSAITPQMLERELRRMARETRMPARLKELFASLDDDPFLVQECLVRPALVERLARGLDPIDPDAAADPPGFLASSSVPLPALRDDVAPLGDPACDADDIWDNGILGGFPRAVSGNTAVWTGTELIVWGGHMNSSALRSGARYDPAIDAWAPTSLDGAPSGRDQHVAVWTGTEMVVWGGRDDALNYLADGARYDPVTDQWAPISNASAPQGRWGATAVWTGNEMIVWGGSGPSSYFSTGGRYDPARDSWSTTKILGAASARAQHSAVWTGAEMLVWGGFDWNGNDLATGGRYSPTTNGWVAINTSGAPSGRWGHAAVWAGTRMVVWGGRTVLAGTKFDTGGRYDPSSNQWSATSMTGAPAANPEPTGVWTGTRMIVWLEGTSSVGGGSYDPAADVWSSVSTIEAPTPRINHSAVWTGDEMIVWGGFSGTSPPDDGGRYDPIADAWTPMNVSNGAPPRRDGHTAVWTGSQMIVWGGGSKATGGRYDPALDAWSETSVVDAPEGRDRHTAVWTGSRMVVWGGRTATTVALATGGRYDPLTDTWTPTTAIGAPEARREHTAAWAGDRMVVWGGTTGSSALASGGRYDPVGDSWQPTSLVGAPPARKLPASVSTGSQMIVWGGEPVAVPFPVATGGVYDPDGDTWSDTPTSGAPQGRVDHSAVWTGSEMLVWGGRGMEQNPVPPPSFIYVYLNTGSRYDPAANHWSPITLTGAPGARFRHAAVWTGDRMLVWGGEPNLSGPFLDSGGTYRPADNSWTPTSTATAPAPRSGHSAMWTGSEMIVWGGSDGAPLGDGGRYTAFVGDLDGDGLTGPCDPCPVDPQNDVDADAVCGDLDNCPQHHNPGQDLVVFPEPVLAADRATLGWSVPADIEFVSGGLAELTAYGFAEHGTSPGADSLDISLEPSVGSGTYYLIKLISPCGSWQSSPDAEPGRDSALP